MDITTIVLIGALLALLTPWIKYRFVRWANEDHMDEKWTKKSDY